MREDGARTETRPENHIWPRPNLRECATKRHNGLASIVIIAAVSSNGIRSGFGVQWQSLRDDGMRMALCQSGSPLPNANASHDVGGVVEGHRGALGETFRLVPCYLPIPTKASTHYTHAASAMQPALVPMGSSASEKADKQGWERTKTSQSCHDIIESVDDSAWQHANVSGIWCLLLHAGSK